MPRANPAAIRHAKQVGYAKAPTNEADSQADHRTTVQLGDAVGLIVEGCLCVEQGHVLMRRALLALDDPRIARRLAQDTKGVRQEALTRVYALLAMPKERAA